MAIFLGRMPIGAFVAVLAACTPESPLDSGDTTDSVADTADSVGDTSDSVGDTSETDLGAIDAEVLTPPVGPADYSEEESDGPGPRRILLARSVDGVHYVRDNVVLTDQGNTPNMLVLPSGRILIYYTGYHLVDDKDNIAVAVSDDNGSTWSYYYAAMNGFGANHPPIGDPDIVQLPDGSFRMYITNGSSDQTIDIISNVSADGFNFEWEGIALDNEGQNRKDSLTQRIGDDYFMYVLQSNDGWMALATSDNGTSFSYDNVASRDMNTGGGGPDQYILSNWMPNPDGGQRIFAFNMENQDIRSFTTVDGATLTPDLEVSLGPPLNLELERSWVKDAAAQQLADGTWLMAYVAEIPI